MGTWIKDIKGRCSPDKAVRYQAKIRSDLIVNNNNLNKNPKTPIAGPKEQVLREYRQGKREVARAKAKELGYSDDIYQIWIKEFEFQNMIQTIYRKYGEKSAEKFFQTINKGQFNGRYRIETFKQWIKNFSRNVDEGR